MTNKDYYYKVEDLRPLASGNWVKVLYGLAPHLGDAIKKGGRHVPCPVHGGKDGFRLHKDVVETGGGVCNTCGPKHDGFEILMWANRWDFSTTLQAIGDLINAPRYLRRTEGSSPVTQAKSSDLKCVSSTEHPKLAAKAVAQAPVALVPPADRPTDPNREKWLEEITEELQVKAKAEEMYRKQLGGRVESLWNSALPLTHSDAKPGINYLRNRGLLPRGLSFNAVRFVKDLGYYDTDGKLIRKCPALVLAIRNKEGELQTLHRIFITKSGQKARVGDPKKMMPLPAGASVNGAAIQLVDLDDSGILSIAEGAETAIATYRAFGFPAWATVNAVLLEQFIPPEGIHTVIIWADKDRSYTGEKVALALKERLEAMGISCYILAPAMPIPKGSKGVDWNDVIIQQGMLGFPRRELFLKAMQSRPVLQKAVSHG